MGNRDYRQQDSGVEGGQALRYHPSHCILKQWGICGDSEGAGMSSFASRSFRLAPGWWMGWEGVRAGAGNLCRGTCDRPSESHGRASEDPSLVVGIT